MPSDPFAPVRSAAEALRDFPAPWWVAGGWAIDLFVGSVTREHEDVEVAILRKDQGHLWRQLGGWDLQRVPRGSGSMVPWRGGEPISPPDHEIHAHREVGELRHLELLLNESSGGLWRFRRNPSIARPIDDVGSRSPDGVPFLVPEIVLLYKAKGTRPRDERDFETALPLLDRGQREWLSYALRACHPEHPWVSRLSGPATS